jgi:folate-binding protein YgfZ
MTPSDALAGIAPLTHWGLIRARGEDAATFLHSQLTNDFSRLGPNEARLAGYCSAKGRLLASFVAWSAGPDEVLLACHKSVLAPTLKRLSMFVLRAKCRLSDASTEIAQFGVAGSAAAAIFGDAAVWQRAPHGAGSAIRLADAAGLRRALLVAPVDLEVDVGAAPAMTLDTWRWLEVESGVVTVEAATVDRFVPQMVNFELVGGVDFQKGCYPGQEVVARSQYRGTTKRRTFLFDCDVLPTAGQDVYAAGAANEPAGTVANAAPHPLHAGGSALVEVRLAALSEAGLRLGSADGPALHQRDLPYPIPLDVTASA